MKGKVIDSESKLPLYFATVSLVDSLNKPTGKAIMTDADGNFDISTTITVSKEMQDTIAKLNESAQTVFAPNLSEYKPKLQISYIGYETLIDTASENKTYSLKPMVISLNEVVIIGKTKSYKNKNKWLLAGLGVIAIGIGYYIYKKYKK